MVELVPAAPAQSCFSAWGRPFPSEGDIAAIKAKRQQQAADEGARVDRITDLQAAQQRGEVSQEEFTKEAERLLGL